MRQLFLMFSGGVFLLNALYLVFIAPHRDSGTSNVLGSIGWIAIGVVITFVLLIVFVLIPFSEMFKD